MTMLKSIACAVVASIAFIGSAASVQAHDFTGVYASVGLGSETSQNSGDAVYDPQNLKLHGIVLNVAAGDNFALGHDLIVGLETNATIGDVKASSSFLDCTVAICGYDETVTESSKSRFSVGVGASLGYKIGSSWLVSADGGFRVSDWSRGFKMVSVGSPDFTYEQRGYRAGGYYGASIHRAINDTLSLTAAWKHSALTELTYNSTYGGSNAVSRGDQFTLSLFRQF
jgi:hypothetical protein